MFSNISFTLKRLYRTRSRHIAILLSILATFTFVIILFITIHYSSDGSFDRLRKRQYNDLTSIVPESENTQLHKDNQLSGSVYDSIRQARFHNNDHSSSIGTSSDVISKTNLSDHHNIISRHTVPERITTATPSKPFIKETVVLSKSPPIASPDVHKFRVLPAVPSSKPISLPVILSTETKRTAVNKLPITRAASDPSIFTDTIAKDTILQQRNIDTNLVAPAVAKQGPNEIHVRREITPFDSKGQKCTGRQDPFKVVPVDVFVPPLSSTIDDTMLWTDKVSAMKKDISKMKIGGEPLRSYIRAEIMKLEHLRREMFCKYLE